jgi:hypothetical protein
VRAQHVAPCRLHLLARFAQPSETGYSDFSPVPRDYNK